MRSLSGGFVRRASLLPALALPAMMMAAQPADAAGLLTPANSSTPLAIEDHHVDVLIEDGYA
ncbi:hypothetical protein, partial [Parvibaculum sp.]